MTNKWSVNLTYKKPVTGFFWGLNEIMYIPYTLDEHKVLHKANVHPSLFI